MANESNEMQKKLSVTRLIGKMNAARLVKADQGRMNCGRFLGVAYGTVEGDSDYGAWMGLRGMFRGINAETGEIINATTCFLPDVAQSPIVAQLRDCNAKAVEFAFDIWATLDENSPVGFSYRAVPLVHGEEDPLDRIQHKIAGTLEAPQGGNPENEGEGEGGEEEPQRKAAGRRGGRR